MDWISFLKVLHIVGWVSWFAGFFYLGRMFVYHRESQDKPQPDRDILLAQYDLMMARAYKIILNPAMMLTWIGGIGMLVVYTLESGSEWIKVNSWMHPKLLLLFLLIGYHIWIKFMIKKLAAGEQPYKSFTFRMLNEMPTLFLVSITSLAIYKNSLNYAYLIAFIVFFTGMLYRGAKAYQRRREQMEADSRTN